MSGKKIAAMICTGLGGVGLLLGVTGSAPLSECMPPTILFGLCAVGLWYKVYSSENSRIEFNVEYNKANQPYHKSSSPSESVEQGAPVLSKEEKQRIDRILAYRMQGETTQIGKLDLKDEYPECDKLLNEVYLFFLKTGNASISMLQRQFRIGYTRAARILDELEHLGAIGPYEGSKARKLCYSKPEWEYLFSQIAVRSYNSKDAAEPFLDITDDFDSENAQSKGQLNFEEIQKLNGYEFEEYCAKLLEKNGYKKVHVTKKSGDQGGDIIAEKQDGTRYAIQCKRYTGSVPNKAVQEAYTAKKMYNCHVAAVMTTSTFTNEAVEAAKKTGVLLWDKNELLRLMKIAKES